MSTDTASGTRLTQREKALLYTLDISRAQWTSTPGSPVEGPVEIAQLENGAVALRNPADPRGLVLRFTAEEWYAFKLGVLDGEFD
ncbi:DUF397 domain-containing protein [Streptomyces sp. NPDC058257]|uniref:DUF397 domain-containing protein n=1 Tax=Streptomyces sp. NPDC058257 TaxID=3346409 RepID=UPI0036F11ACC